MANKAKKVINSLSDLNKLVNTSIKSDVVQQQVTAPTNIVLDEDDTVSIVLWKVLRDLRPRSLSEIQRRVESITMQQSWYDGSLIDRLNVQAIVLTLARTGTMIKDVNNGITRYAFTPDAPMPKHPEGINMTSAKESPIENLDVAIWQYYSDLRPHSINDAALVLVSKGFDNRVIRDRIVVLARRNDWFTRNGSGNKLKYVLKKSRTMPVTTVAEIIDKSKRTPFHEPKTVIKSDKGPNTPAVATVSELVSGKGTVTAEPKVIFGTGKVSDKPIVDTLINVGKVTIPPTSKTVTETKVNQNHACDIKTAIKEVMADNEFYSLADLNILLSDYLKQNAIENKQYITTHMQSMRVDNLFNVEKRGNANYYQLKPAAKLPDYMDVYASNNTATTMLADSVVSDKAKEKINDVAVTKNVASEPTSFKVLICIKDKYYTTAQTKKIVDALIKFVAQKEVVDDIISLTYQLRLSGNNITIEEAKILLKEFEFFGFNEE